MANRTWEGAGLAALHADPDDMANFVLNLDITA
jgi:hypothetical protein